MGSADDRRRESELRRHYPSGATEQMVLVNEENGEEVEALTGIDTGAFYTSIGQDLTDEIGIDTSTRAPWCGGGPRLRQGDSGSVQRRGGLRTPGHRACPDGGSGAVLGRDPRRRVLVQRGDGSRLPRCGPGDRRRPRAAGYGGQRPARAVGSERNRRRPRRAPRRDRRVPPE